jgi:rhodanese-related sulfurtransferase
MLPFKLLFVAVLSCALAATAQLPFKEDNKTYKTIYLKDAFRLMDSSGDYLLLDVRSPGEYADTSRYTALNIGHLKGAVNINIDDIPGHLADLKKNTGQPIFVYCSHSQRSRRVSKLLMENGFANVYNINGGMSLLNESDEKDLPYKATMLVTNTNYKNVSNTEDATLMKNNPDMLIIDIRTAAEFASRDSIQQHNIGHLKNAINIPQDVFATKLAGLKMSADKPVLIYDLKGYNSMDVINMVKARGVTRVYNLYGGLSGFACDHALKGLRDQLITGAPAYHMLDTRATIGLLEKTPGLVIFDTRPADEFDNKATMSHMNLGRLDKAVPVTTVEMLEKNIQDKPGSTVFLVYGSGDDFSTVACQFLIKKGFKQVNQLSPGLYQFVWSTANVDGCQAGRKFLVNHEGLY